MLYGQRKPDTLDELKAYLSYVGNAINRFLTTWVVVMSLRKHTNSYQSLHNSSNDSIKE